MTIHQVAPPHPKWKIGDPVDSPVKEMESLDFSKLSGAEAYRVMSGAILPRPIALVSTISNSGQSNLAPFSFFNGVCSAPPVLCFSVTPKRDGVKKDTLINIEENGEFVVNIVAEWMAEPVNQTSADYPYGVDEAQAVGLTSIPSLEVRPVRIQESPIHFECRLEQLVPVGGTGLGSAVLVLGRILRAHIHRSAYQGGIIKVDEILPLSRLGGPYYGRLTEIFELPRPIR